MIFRIMFALVDDQLKLRYFVFLSTRDPFPPFLLMPRVATEAQRGQMSGQQQTRDNTSFQKRCQLFTCLDAAVSCCCFYWDKGGSHFEFQQTGIVKVLRPPELNLRRLEALCYCDVSMVSSVLSSYPLVATGDLQITPLCFHCPNIWRGGGFICPIIAHIFPTVKFSFPPLKEACCSVTLRAGYSACVLSDDEGL